MIKIIDLSKPAILSKISIEIKPGITFIKGTNGSGKTTLLDCIAGIDQKYSGHITGNDNVIYLNQTLYFYGRIKVKDLIQFLMGLNNQRDAITYYEKNSRLRRKGNMIKKLYNKPVGKLSGGEIKILYFSIITAMNRNWYLFDEPFSQIDIEGKMDIIDIFKELIQEKKNIIITNHEEFFLNEFPDTNIIDMDYLQLRA